MKAKAGKPPSADLWDPRADYIRVMLHNIRTEARVGIHPWEQHPERPNRLLVDIDMFARALPPGEASRETIIDYDALRDHLRTWPGRPQIPYLEDLAEELIAVCFRNPRVAACRVSVTKPDIFNEIDRAGVEIYRLRPKSGG